MSTSAGQISLDLVLNKKEFNKQMKGIRGLAIKTGAALASAFAVKEIAQFASECMQLGSDLNEVENVVNTAFPKMNAEMDAWAKRAAVSFGLSETMAKRYAGTFGAMTKSFGFTEKKAYEMSTTLTGLAGDLASFYNISQDEAYTKLKSVFTGETETLKDLGVVMTQNALDAYALANGYNKTTSAMSEQEKVALRYNFVLEKLDMASGDFIRTQDSWANQVRILKLQFDSLKATLGQGFINLFTPILKVINLVIAKLATLANTFKAFTELITGRKGDAGTNTFNQTQTSAEGASEAVSGVADSINKTTAAAKKNQRITMGLDELNMIPEQTDAGAGGSAGIGDIDFGNLADGETALDKLNESTGILTGRLKALKDLIVSEWKLGIEDTAKKFRGICDSHFIPAFQIISNGFRRVFDAVRAAGSQYLMPVLMKIAEQFKILRRTALQPVIDKFIELAGNIALCVAAIWDTLSPLAAWLAGKFVEAISYSLSRAGDLFFLTFTWIAGIVTGLLETLNGLIIFLTGVFSFNWKTAWIGIKTTLHGIWETVKAVFAPFTDWLQQKVITPVIDMIATIKATLGTVASWIQKQVLNPVQTGFAKFWDGIKKVCNAILTGVETMVNGIVRGINRMINALNSLSFDIPEWVPGLGGESFGLNLPTISQVTLPRLADGGYVKKNTPQLAMIGDNRHQGEVVAPEAKLLEMARLAAESSTGNLTAVIAAIERLKEAILENQDVPVDVIVDVDGDVIYRVVQKASRKRGVDFKMGAFER